MTENAELEPVGSTETRTVWFVESGDGERLTEDFDTIDKAREYASEVRERLIEQVIDSCSNVHESQLVWDYGVRQSVSHNGGSEESN